MRARSLAVAVMLACAGTACHAPRADFDGDRATARSAGVTGEDIRRAGGSTALDGVRLLVRTADVTGRSVTSLRDGRRDPPRVYLDGARLGNIETLSQVHYTEVLDIRYLDATSATLRYGTGHFGGALLVRTIGAGHDLRE